MKKNIFSSLFYIFASYIALAFVVLLSLVLRTGKPVSPTHALYLLSTLWIAVALSAQIVPFFRVQLAMRRRARPIEDVDMRVQLQIALATAGTALLTADVLIGYFSGGAPVNGVARFDEVILVLVFWLQVPTWQRLAKQVRTPGHSRMVTGIVD